MAQRWPHPIAWRFSSIADLVWGPVPRLDVVPFGRRAPRSSGSLAAPFPAGDLGHVVAVLGDVLLVLDQLVPDRLLRVGRPRPGLRQPGDEVGDQLGALH